MADIINLRTARKKQERAAKEKRAEANRARFGLSKAQKDAARRENERSTSVHESHRQDDE
ncbi:MAG: DUF4169 family protein [Parvularcula sp.]